MCSVIDEIQTRSCCLSNIIGYLSSTEKISSAFLKRNLTYVNAYCDKGFPGDVFNFEPFYATYE